LQSGGIDLPWAAIAGFVDVMAVMAAAILLAHRYERRAVRHPIQKTPTPAAQT
jgi:CAAX protease family protein